MSKIKQLIQMHEQGESNRKIAAHLQMNKETVNPMVGATMAVAVAVEEASK